ncbi:MAG: lanthionine synthetase C family protein [bacterium]|nr:lanthionine synthetase C family protein [bacterium]
MGNNQKSRPAWRPIFSGDEAKPYLEVIHDLARFFSAPVSEWQLAEPTQWSWAEVPRTSYCHGLADGVAGISLFLAYYHQAFGGENIKAAAIALLEEEFSHLQLGVDNFTYFSGLPGVGWATQHIQARVFGDQENLLEDADDLLVHFATAAPADVQFDLVSGWVGVGLYFLERLPRRAAAAGLSAVIDRLSEMVEFHDDGAAWLTGPRLMNPEQRRMYPLGYYNLGVAHGTPGVVGLLGRAAAWDGAPAGTADLFDRAARWLWKQRRPTAEPSRFPLWRPAGDQADEKRDSRQAWCYGDVGVSLAVYSAAKIGGFRDHADRAFELASQSLSVDPHMTGVVDPGICHGASGLGHIYNRFYQATGRAEFSGAARYWFDRCLRMRTDDAGLAGFLEYNISLYRKARWQSTPGVLTGAAGIGLALLAATTHDTPAWDRFLLLDIEGDMGSVG